MPQVSSTKIDLSSGLVPASGAIDLSAGLAPIEEQQEQAAPEQPGFFKRLGQSVGVPTSSDELKQTVSSMVPKSALDVGMTLANPANMLARNMVRGYAHTAGEGIKQGVQETKEAGENIAAGQPVLPNIFKGLYGGMHAGLQATPFIGPPIETAGEDIQNKNYRGAAGGLTGVIGQLALASKPGQALAEKGTALVKRAPEAVASTARRVYGIKNPDVLTAEQSATKALKPRNAKVNFQNELKTALPDARRAADSLGIDVNKMDISAAQEAVGKAKRDVWGEYEHNYLNPNERALVDTNPVARTIRNTVSKRTYEQNPTLAQKIHEVADSYIGRELPVAELEQRVQELNNETRAIEARYPTDKAAAKVAPENAYVFAERQALNNLLQSKLDELAGPGSHELRQRYGALKSLQDVLDRRKQVFERQAPEGLVESMGKMAGAGQVAKGVGEIITARPLKGLVSIAGGIAERKSAKASRLMNDSEYLLRQAFRKTRPSPTAVTRQPIVPMIRGLLGKGPTPLGAAPDSSGSVPYTPPAYSPLTRAQRLGRLLPESTSIDLPAVPEQPMEVLPAQSRVTRDTNTGRMRRQYLTSPKGEQSSQPPFSADVYHHSKSGKFDQFDFNKAGSSTDEGLLGKGAYFSTDSQIGSRVELPGATVKAHVELKNPLQIQFPKWGANKTALVNEKLGTSGLKGQALSDALAKQGYDGVVLDYSPVGYAHKEVMATNPEQIKIAR